MEQGPESVKPPSCINASGVSLSRLLLPLLSLHRVSHPLFCVLCASGGLQEASGIVCPRGVGPRVGALGNGKTCKVQGNEFLTAAFRSDEAQQMEVRTGFGSDPGPGTLPCLEDPVEPRPRAEPPP